MTSDIEFLRSLDVPLSILAERTGRTETAITFELKELEGTSESSTQDRTGWGF